MSSGPERPSGVLVALVTPIDEGGDLDLPGLDRLLERVVTAGIRGVCPVGSTGEGPRLTRSQRLAVVERVRSQLPLEVPVIPAPSVQNHTDTLAEVEELAARGSNAVLVAPPSYYVMSDDEVLRFYERLADASPLPILLYNFPALTKVHITPEVVARLAGHPSVVGMKDSSRDLEYFTAALYATSGRSDFSLLTGSDTLLLASLALGGDGAIGASANLAPELACALYQAATWEDWGQARALQRRLFELVSACRRGGFPAGWKAALELAGLCRGHPAPPGSPLGAEDRAALQRRLSELGVL